MLFGRVAEIIEHEPRLHASRSCLDIDVDQPMHILRTIQHNGVIAALSGQACPATSREDRCVIRSGSGNGPQNVVSMAGNHHPNRHLPIIGCVRRIEGTTAFIKPDFSLYVFSKRVSQPLHINATGQALPHRCTRFRRRGSLVSSIVTGGLNVNEGFSHVTPDTGEHPDV